MILLYKEELEPRISPQFRLKRYTSPRLTIQAEFRDSEFVV
jgi:hypothetical protein